MTKRKEFTSRTKIKAFEATGGRCNRCTRKVGLGGEPAEYHHKVTCEDGGDNSLDNCEVLCAACHSHQTHKIEAPAKAEGRRHTAKRAGVKKKTRNQLPGGRGTKIKIKVGGEVVRR